MGQDGDGLPDADGWLRALVDEVVIDTHCAFYNGRVLGPGVKTLDDRAFDHALVIRSFLNSGLTSLTGPQRSALLVPPLKLRLDLARNAKRWDEALEALEQLRAIDPDRAGHLDRIVEIEFQRTFDALKNGKGRDDQLSDAAVLQQGIGRLEEFRRQYLHNLSAFEALGHLHHARAVKLANAHRASEALVEAQRALDYAPTLEGAETTREEIDKLLKNLIERVKELRRDIARHLGAQLNDDGRRLCAEADKGYKPLNDYVESGRSQETAQALVAAKNRDIWQRVGLPPPPDRFDERCEALVWRAFGGSADPAGGRGRGRVRLGFGRRSRRRAPHDRPRAGRPVPDDLPPRKHRRGSDVHRWRSSSTVGTSGPPAVLEARTVGKRGAGEPFEFWLLSRRDIGIKALAVAAVVLLTVGAVMAARRARNDRGRDDAFGRVVQSQRDRDYLGIIRGSETFLDHSPLRGRDPREGRVRELYDEAMVRWFIGRGSADDPEVREHIERFRRLTASARS